jgi:hypothetical protein
MTTQEIYQNMTKGEWRVEGKELKDGDTSVALVSGNHSIDFTKVRPRFAKRFVTDAHAKAIAVNNTFGKGINPESVPRSMEFIDRVEKYLKSKWDDDLDARKLLNILIEMPKRRIV